MSRQSPGFVDEAIIEVESGAGGNGALAFRREKYVPRGGPDGGNGGRGGDVVVVAQASLRTLVDFQYRRHFKAHRGAHGEGSNRKGRAGDDCILHVPPGVQVYDDDRHELITDLAHAGDSVIVARGGRGGRGNAHFKTAMRTAPAFAEKGEPAECLRLRLVLKSLADVGIIGFPNVGKSTLIARISAARPKIADYPFTTLVPHLGTVRLDHETSFVVADVPGLVEGAHAGVGLGHTFLRHIERTHVLVHMIDMAAVEGRDPLHDFEIINRELALFDPAVAAKPQLVAANKIDLAHARENFTRLKLEFERREFELIAISAVTGEGIEPLLWRMAALVKEKTSHESQAEAPRTFRRRVVVSEKIEVTRESGNAWRISGRPIEKLIAMTDLSNDEAVDYLHQRLDRMGIIKLLKSRGVQQGDVVRVNQEEFTFEE